MMLSETNTKSLTLLGIPLVGIQASCVPEHHTFHQLVFLLNSHNSTKCIEGTLGTRHCTGFQGCGGVQGKQCPMQLPKELILTAKALTYFILWDCDFLLIGPLPQSITFPDVFMEVKIILFSNLVPLAWH